MISRLGRRLIGFASEQDVDETAAGHSAVLSQVQPEDLVHYGMIPELIGRLPCVTSLGPLDQEAMVRILTEPRNAIVRQYEHFFDMEKAELQFTDEALAAIAKKAIKREVGARALRAVVEEMMLDLMYELPDQTDNDGQVYEITADMVTGKSETNLFTARKVKKESA